MKNTYLLLLFTGLLIVNTVNAQTDAQKAQIRVHITNANSALQSSNWDQALNNVNKAQDVLGSSAAIFESIKIKAYHGKKKYQKAKEHLLIFFQLNPADNLIDEIAPISADIDNKIEAEIAEQKRIKEEKKKAEEERLKRIQAEKEREIAAKQKEEKEKKELENFVNNINPSDYDFKDGLAVVEFNNKRGVIDKSGQIVIPIAYQYLRLDEFSEYAMVVYFDGKYGFIDHKGNRLTSMKYDKWSKWNVSGDIAKVVMNGYVGFVDNTGKEITSPKFGHVLYEAKEGMVQVGINKKIGFINDKGVEVIPPQFEYVKDFADGLAAVKKNNKYGYINKSGKLVIPFKYGFAKDFSEGLAAVRLGEDYGYIDKSGRVVISFQFFKAYNFESGKARVWPRGRDPKQYYINKNGKKVRR